jgi:UDP-N-acetylmuramyl pentapeptide synthase
MTYIGYIIDGRGLSHSNYGKYALLYRKIGEIHGREIFEILKNRYGLTGIVGSEYLEHFKKLAVEREKSSLFGWEISFEAI